ncbi:MAG TPA: UbiA family prenyltransferase, partial [Acidobacteriota bacterium]
SLIYSAPPFRLRRRLFSSVFIGWGSVLAFLIGYWNRMKIVDVALPLLAAKIVAVIFVSFSIGSLTKDLKDYRGDSKNGIRNICTVYGYQTGKRIITGLLCFSLLTPILIYQQSFDLTFFILAAVFTSILFYASENYLYSFLGYGLTFTYCAFRYLNLI